MDNELDFFINAFREKVGKTPKEFIQNKLKAGSEIDAIYRLFDIISHSISLENNCKTFDLNTFYAETDNENI